MQDELLPFYEQELSYLRKAAREFADKYPKIASRLRLEGDTCEDPHVERLLQGFAWLTARIQRKIDAEFPQVAEALLQVMYPHLLAPVPSAAIVQFAPDAAQGALSEGFRIAANTGLYSRPVNGTPCRFKTCYPLTLWPLEVAAAGMLAPDSVPEWPAGAMAALQLSLRCLGVASFADLELDTLRFYLNGESRLVYRIYELLFTATRQIVLQGAAQRRVNLSPASLRPVGFAIDEGLLPYPEHAFAGYRLLQEYFTFPEKFLFVEISGLGALSSAAGETLNILLFFDQPEAVDIQVEAANFLLGCTPAVNLFPKIAEPVNVDHLRSSYPIIPDLRRRPDMEVFSIEKVVSLSRERKSEREIQPLYAYRHADAAQGSTVHWYATRRVAPGDEQQPSELLLSLVDPQLGPAVLPAETLTVQTICTNGNLPSRLPFGDPRGDFELEGGAPIQKIRCLKKPTPGFQARSGGELMWRLISHLSLNYLSLCEGEGARRALQEMLLLYNFRDSAATRQHIEGIVEVASERTARWLHGANGGAVVQGLKVRMVLDEEKFVGGGLYLFAAVLERFLSLYVSINSFTQLEVTTRQRLETQKGILKQWPPRAGEQILL